MSVLGRRKWRYEKSVRLSDVVRDESYGLREECDRKWFIGWQLAFRMRRTVGCVWVSLQFCGIALVGMG
jgi:hypothetical protein